MQSFEIEIPVGYGTFLTGIFSYRYRYLRESLPTMSEYIKISVADPDPEFDALAAPGPGMGKKSRSGSYFREPGNNT
jgi:hypothetical protein